MTVPLLMANTVEAARRMAMAATIYHWGLHPWAMYAVVALSLALFPFLAHVGIAIATAASGWVNTILLVYTLHRRGHFSADASLRKRLPMILLAAVLMGVGLVLAMWLLAPLLAEPSFAIRASAVAFMVVAGMVLFALFCQLTGAADFRRAIGLALRRR